MPDRRTGLVVSHTHWDRAWYLPFETFRHRLVRLVDDLLDLLEDDPAFEAFTLDGQTVLLEDYLELRPQNEERLRRLVEAGRLFIGPWYTLPDLFLVSGEAIVRNLQEGFRTGERFGGVMPVGYIPDPFGHVAQMPQIMRGFGIDTYFFMRGATEALKERCGALFHWRAPDGSTVLTTYQRDGYFGAGALGHPDVFGRFDGHEPNVEAARAQIAEAVERMAALQEEPTLLLMNGFDHMPPQPELPRLLQAVDEALEDVDLVHGSIPDYARRVREEVGERPEYAGDLIGNADHPILLSVYSTRIYLKQQNHRAQHGLTHLAEPLSAWLHATGRGPDARTFLRHAWRTLLRNHPHDDICGCSVDAVHEEDEQRFREVDQTTDALVVEHLETLARDGFEAAPQSGEHGSDVFVFNGLPFARRVRAEATVLFPNPDGEAGEPLPEHPLAAVDADGTPLRLAVLATEPHVMRNHYLEQTWGRRYRVSFEVDLPSMGYQLVHVYQEAHESAPPAPGASLENDRYRVQAGERGLHLTDRLTGRRFERLLRFEYQRDAGDTYSFSPVEGDAPRWARFIEAHPHPTRPHTLAARYAIEVPASLETDETVTLALEVDVRLEPEHGVGFHVRYENRAENGRLRAVFPLGLHTDRARADGHFRLAERIQQPFVQPEDAPERYEGYPGELRYDTHHQGAFCLVDGGDHHLWIANRGNPEFALVDLGEQTGVAVTLHRAVGHLSVTGGRIRRCGAGPHVPTPGAQCLRPLEAHLGFGTTEDSVDQAAREARAFAQPPYAREMPHLPYVDAAGEQPRTRSLLRLDDPHVVLSALKPENDGPGVVVRLFNPSSQPREATLQFGWPVEVACAVDLHEEWDEAAATPITDGALTLTLAPHRIATLLVRGV